MLNIHELAERCKCHHNTLRRELARGNITASYVEGNKYLWTEEDGEAIAAYLKYKPAKGKAIQPRTKDN